MEKQEQTAAAPYRNGAGPTPAVLRADPRPRIGLRIDLHTTSPGAIEFRPSPDHRLRIHAGTPVRGLCRSSRFLYAPGDIDIFPAGLSDTWEQEATSTALIVQLSPSLLHRAAEDMGLDPARVGLEERHHFRDPQIEHIAWALDAERRAGSPAGLLYTESLGMALAVHLLGDHRAPFRPQGGLSKAQLGRVTAFVEEHLDQDLSLTRLAGVAGVSASHLKTLFRRSTGLPVHEYVVQRRVERAKVLLLRGELPVSQVALEAGFAHQSHMARCMRRILGVTPASVVRRPRTV